MLYILHTYYHRFVIKINRISDAFVDLWSELHQFTFVPKVIFLHRCNDISRISFFHCNMKPSQIRISCLGTRKCLHRYEIDHFCLGNICVIQPSEIPSESNRGAFGCTHPTPDVHVKPSWSFRQIRNWRLGCVELRIKHILQFMVQAQGFVIMLSKQIKSISLNQINESH